MATPTIQDAVGSFGAYTPGTSVDARPILARSPNNIWEATEALRSQLHAAIRQECADQNVEALVLQSTPYTHPAWVKFESWFPNDDQTLTRRSSMTVTITAVPYHRFTAIYKVELEWQGSKRVVDQLHTLDAALIRELVTRLTAPRTGNVFGDEIAQLARLLKRNQLRQAVYQLWKPKNKITAFRTDWLKLAGLPLLLVSLLVAYSAPTAVPDPTGPVLAGIAGVLVGALVLRHVMLKPRLVRSPGKPVAEPRVLVNLDSWQTVVFGAGHDVAQLNSQITTMLGAGANQRFHCAVEHIWHWGLDGAEEREQIILSYGRALVFAQVYAYGSDLYVGWDAQMNLGQWVEKHLRSGLERSSGERVDLKTVESGFQATNEYDLIDLNCLAEWTHAQITYVLKHYIKERHIDQEIDFKIIRGERKAIGDASEKKGERKKKFQRTG